MGGHPTASILRSFGWSFMTKNEATVPQPATDVASKETAAISSIDSLLSIVRKFFFVFLFEIHDWSQTHVSYLRKSLESGLQLVCYLLYITDLSNKPRL